MHGSIALYVSLVSSSYEVERMLDFASILGLNVIYALFLAESSYSKAFFFLWLDKVSFECSRS
jgi:hypothetical protein